MATHFESFVTYSHGGGVMTEYEIDKAVSKVNSLLVVIFSMVVTVGYRGILFFAALRILGVV